MLGRSRQKNYASKGPKFSMYDNFGPYLVSRYSGDGIAIAHLTEAEQTRLEKETELRIGRDHLYSAGPYATAAAIYLGAASSLPLWAAATGYFGSWAAGMGLQARSAVANKVNRRAQRKVADTISVTPERYMYFSKENIKFDLPSSVLDTMIEFESETGRTERSVKSLAESAKGDLFGIKLSTDGREYIEGSISPGNLLATALCAFPRDRKGAFLTSSIESIERIHGAAQGLPRYLPSLEDLPEGMRILNERHKTNLLVGALGVYGVLRAQFGVAVSERINEAYGMHGNADLGEDPLLRDAMRFATPTEEDLTWRQITRTSSYLSSIGIQDM